VRRVARRRLSLPVPMPKALQAARHEVNAALAQLQEANALLQGLASVRAGGAADHTPLDTAGSARRTRAG
jgi:hypothetical protein